MLVVITTVASWLNVHFWCVGYDVKMFSGIPVQVYLILYILLFLFCLFDSKVFSLAMVHIKKWFKSILLQWEGFSKSLDRRETVCVDAFKGLYICTLGFLICTRRKIRKSPIQYMYTFCKTRLLVVPFFMIPSFFV